MIRTKERIEPPPCRKACPVALRITQRPPKGQPKGSAPRRRGVTGQDRYRWGIARGCFLVALAVPSLPELARAGSLEGDAGLGIGIIAIGGRRSTGGVTLLPTGTIGWRFAEWGSLRYRNTLLIFNLAAIHWIGLVDMNTAIFGLHLGRFTLELGPSLDVFALPLCANTWCQREHGLAAGGHVGAVLFPSSDGRFATGATVHLTDIPGIAWSGLAVTAAFEGRYHW